MFTRGEAIGVLAVSGLIVVAPTGFIVGNIAGHKRIPINGSMDRYNLYKDELKGYSIKK